MIGVRRPELGWYLQWVGPGLGSLFQHVCRADRDVAVVLGSAITLLFRTRDRLLVWQKGVVKW